MLAADANVEADADGAVESMPFVASDAPKDPDEMERRLAKEMASLSLDERSSILDDVHGVSCWQERRDVLKDLLEDMYGHLKRMLEEFGDGTMAFRKAHEQDPKYVLDRSFCLMFLRCESYRPEPAAKRLALHMTYKLSLFGRSKLTKDIELEDMDHPGDLYCLQSGYLRCLSVPDRSGRAIIFVQPALLKYYTLENIMRCYWYVQMQALKDEMVQLNGIVYVAYNIGPGYETDFGYLKPTALARHAVPCRVCANHLLVAHPSDEHVLSQVRYYLERPVRLRFRGHVGSHEQVLSLLRGYGVVLLAFRLPLASEMAMVVKAANTHQLETIEELVRQRKRKLLEMTASELEGGATSGKKPDENEETAPRRQDKNDGPQEGLGLNLKELSTDMKDDDSSKRRVSTPTFARKYTNASKGNATEGRGYKMSNVEMTDERLHASICQTQSAGSGSDSYETINSGHRRASRASDPGPVQVKSSHKLSPGKAAVLKIPSDGDSITPTENDVLLGSSVNNKHAGNRRLQKIVRDSHPAYAAAGKTEKGVIVDSIVQSVILSGGRFLKRHEVFCQTWVLADPAASRKKVSNMMVKRRF